MTIFAHTTLHDVRPQLPYLEAVLQESMRLYPAASTLIREPPEDLDLGGGVVVPKWVWAQLRSRVVPCRYRV